MTDPKPPEMEAPQSGVKVRMYRVGGLGDCFLLAFRTRARRARYMLIDCGVFLGTKDGSKRLQAVARDIQAATGGRIHVLVATHEHWDHLSGFQYARKIFDQIEVDEAWLAWTESPGHPLAEQMRKRREITLRALDTALHQLQSLHHPLAGRIEGILSFHDFLAADTKLKGSAGLIQYPQQKAKVTRYLTPKQPPLTWSDVQGVRIFVLGPPEDEKLLTRSDPSGLEGEVYERPESLNTAAAFYASVLAGDDPSRLSPAEEDIFKRSLPFDRVHGIRIQEASRHPDYGLFFQQHYGFAQGPEGDQGSGSDPAPAGDPASGGGPAPAGDPGSEGAQGPGGDPISQGPEWRRIDMDWWGQVENLALHLDRDTNNTSLALAIELPGGKVLLFPGDAQVGNWHSWHDLSWPDEKGEPVTPAQLLQRTVLYKVGHHGSHNATLRDKGLELMTRPDLVAMIPVSKDAAEQRGWAMPFPSLQARLKEKTRGRILYSDPSLPPVEEAVTPEGWDIANCCVNVDPSDENLWVELVIETRESQETPPPVEKVTPPRRTPPLTKRHTPE
ncbi:MAG TPA: MBL fold metallo-hydrolase [Anaerolineae bacterium]|nr:MBL fold metallo-hydrolase [Anaerolineae bacterium]